MTIKKSRGTQRCIYMPKILDEQLKEYSLKTDLPVSYIVKTALKEFFASRNTKDYIV